MSQEFLFPVGRLVGGSVYTAYKAENDDGSPKMGSDGKQLESYSFSVAFKKFPGQTHWAQAPDAATLAADALAGWGAKIWAEGHAGWGEAIAGHPSFAWKIKDGDSKQAGKPYKGKPTKAPADNEGWPGHWVVKFSGTYAPKTCSADGKLTYTDDVQRIKPGHFVQVYGQVQDNKPSQSPGVYINYRMTAHSGFGPEIASAGSVDASAVGFGGALPAGASVVPLAQMTPTQAAGVPATPAAALGVPPAPGAVAQPSSALPGPIVPNPAILGVPAAPGAPAAPPAAPPTPPAPPAGPVMLAAANGVTYAAYIEAGWSPAQMVAAGVLAP